MTEQPKVEHRVTRPKRWRRIAWALATGAVLVGLAVAYLHLFHHRPVGDGPAGPPVDRGAFDSIWTTRPVLLLGLGDSVTAGFGAPRDYSYFDRLVVNPPDDPPDVNGLCLSRVLPNLQTLNLSVSGSTSPEHLASQIPRIPAQNADVFGLIVITTGGNDIIHDYGRRPAREGAMYGATMAQARPWIDEFEIRLETMLASIDDRFPGGCEIFLANIYDPTDGVGDIESAGLPPWPDGLAVLGAYNRIIAETAQRRANVHQIDLHGAFLGHGIHCTQFWRSTYRSEDPHYWYYYNLEDPNVRGYDAIRRLFLGRIVAVAEETLGTP